MQRQRSSMSLVGLGACCVGLMAWMLGVATGPAAGKATKGSTPKVTVITVTVGKPSELAFKLSKSSALPAGTVTFKVTNAGKVTHNFKICTSPVTTSSANSCVGKVTKMLTTGQSVTLTVTLTKSGKYEYLCTVPGHANAGMKGLLGIGVKIAAPTPTATPAPTPAPAPTPTPAPAAATCNSPKSTTVTVNEFDFGFTLSTTTVPCGSVTFNQTNSGGTSHDFVVQGLTGGAGIGATIAPAATTTMTVSLTPGNWPYVCDIANHAGLGMTGVLAVTG